MAYLFLQIMLSTQVEAAEPLSYQEWKEARQQLSQPVEEDVINLNDGSQLKGSFDMIPPLYYSFGQMSFNPEELDAVIFFTKDDLLKGQYITRNGQKFDCRRES